MPKGSKQQDEGEMVRIIGWKQRDRNQCMKWKGSEMQNDNKRIGMIDWWQMSRNYKMSAKGSGTEKDIKRITEWWQKNQLKFK